MATTPGTVAANLASGVVGVYADVEATLIAKMAEHLAKGIETPEWQTKQLAEVRAFRADAEYVLKQTRAKTDNDVKKAMIQAATAGHQTATKELGQHISKKSGGLYVNTQAVSALAAEASTKISGTHFGILRSTDDAYRDVIRRALNAPLIGVETRTQAAQRALNEFASQGITGFVDSKGRNWSLASYVETSMRTGLMNANLEGHATKLKADGRDLIVVSDHTQECKLCRPFEGKVLSLSGGDASVMSLVDAKAGGLFHPNCRHSFSAYFPGVSKSFGATADPQGDADRQKLRKLERDVRSLKRVEAGALTPEAKKAAKQRVTAKQKEIAAHVNTTSAKRQRDREQITGVFGDGNASDHLQPGKLPKLPSKKTPGVAGKSKPSTPTPSTPTSKPFEINVAPPAKKVPVKIDTLPSKLPDNPFGKTQLTGSFAPKASPTSSNPFGKKQLTGSFAPKPPPPVSAPNPLSAKASEVAASTKPVSVVEKLGKPTAKQLYEAQNPGMKWEDQKDGLKAFYEKKVAAQSLPSAPAVAKKAAAKKAAPKVEPDYITKAKAIDAAHKAKVAKKAPAKKAAPKPFTPKSPAEYEKNNISQLKKYMEKKYGDTWVVEWKKAMTPGTPTKHALIESLTGTKFEVGSAAPGRKGARTLSEFAVPDPDAPLGSALNPRNFDTRETGKEYASKLNENDVRKWPQEQGRAVQTYTDEDYIRINRYMRGQEKKRPKEIEALDKAFDVPEPTKEWMITTRGTDAFNFGLGKARATAAELKALVGKEHTEKGYMSTSIKNKPAFGGHVQMIIRNPPGTRGIYVDGAPGQHGHELTVNKGEDEFLLARETRFRIVNVGKGTNGFAHDVVVEIIQQHGGGVL